MYRIGEQFLQLGVNADAVEPGQSLRPVTRHKDALLQVLQAVDAVAVFARNGLEPTAQGVDSLGGFNVNVGC